MANFLSFDCGTGTWELVVDNEHWNVNPFMSEDQVDGEECK